MNPKAKRFLWVLATMVAAAALVGMLVFQVFQTNQTVLQDKAQKTEMLNQINAENAAKQKELEESKTDDWIKEQAHQIGMVSPGEVKIVDENK